MTIDRSAQGTAWEIPVSRTVRLTHVARHVHNEAGVAAAALREDLGDFGPTMITQLRPTLPHEYCYQYIYYQYI